MRGFRPLPSNHESGGRGSNPSERATQSPGKQSEISGFELSPVISRATQITENAGFRPLPAVATPAARLPKISPRGQDSLAPAIVADAEGGGER
jgi:hypothetical protein